MSITSGGITVFRQEVLKKALWVYGEEAAVDSVAAGLTTEQVRSIGIRHSQLTYESDPDSQSGKAYASDKALAMAAVEVLEGRRRMLARKRRRSSERST